MKVVVINCFDTYEQRVNLVYRFFTQKEYDVSVIQSDYRHFEKVKRSDSKTDFIFIKSQPYLKNMSLKRLISHYRFAKDAFKLVEKLKPDILYLLLPPNSLAKFADEYKKKHKNIKLYFDIIDLWPETMPIKDLKILPPFIIWRRLRDKHLIRANFVVTECDLYQKVLENSLKGINTGTVYLARQEKPFVSNPRFQKGSIHLSYLGSINNIIDIPMIKKIINAINKIKPVVLHVIGDGENKDILLKEVEKTGTLVKYYGNIYQSKIKQQIFDNCHFGLNIMKKTVCVGLTMKSIDYFEAGLPILNNINVDTSRLIKEYQAGINIIDCEIEKIAENICQMTEEELLFLRAGSRKVFEKEFTEGIFNKKLESFLS